MTHHLLRLLEGDWIPFFYIQDAFLYHQYYTDKNNPEAAEESGYDGGCGFDMTTSVILLDMVGFYGANLISFGIGVVVVARRLGYEIYEEDILVWGLENGVLSS